MTPCPPRGVEPAMRARRRYSKSAGASTLPSPRTSPRRASRPRNSSPHAAQDATCEAARGPSAPPSAASSTSVLKTLQSDIKLKSFAPRAVSQIRLQLVAQERARAVDARLHSALIHLKYARDLFVTALLNVAQHERRAVLLRQRRDRARDRRTPLVLNVGRVLQRPRVLNV